MFYTQVKWKNRWHNITQHTDKREAEDRATQLQFLYEKSAIRLVYPDGRKELRYRAMK